MLRDIPRHQLGFFPTPVTELKRLSAVLGGPRILIKRDDLSGLAMGGNKVRKLEYFVGEAMARGCDTLITGGAEQSNHCRQTAAAAAACGMSCHLVLGGSAPQLPNGNILLDLLLGAQIHWTGALRKGESIPAITESLRQAGKKPFVIPYGGSNEIGALGFVEAARELGEQLRDLGETVTRIVFPSSSGATQAGLTIGKHLFGQSYEVVGIAIDKGETGEGPFDEHVLDIVNATASRLKVGRAFSLRDIRLRSEFVGQGYAVVGELERRAIRLAAQTEGILVDPVYTGRALGALIAMIEAGEFARNGTVLFWHTGGTPALFPYAGDILAAGQ
jgi:D-cysteine desulfhydrase